MSRLGLFSARWGSTLLFAMLLPSLWVSGVMPMGGRRPPIGITPLTHSEAPQALRCLTSATTTKKKSRMTPNPHSSSYMEESTSASFRNFAE